MRSWFLLLLCLIFIGESCSHQPSTEGSSDEAVLVEKPINKEIPVEWMDNLVLAPFLENDLDLLLVQPSFWNKLTNNGIRSIVIPASFVQKHPISVVQSFLEKARNRSIHCFVSWQGASILKDKSKFLKELKEWTAIFSIKGILFEKIEAIESSFWIEAATKVEQPNDLLLLANGKVHPSSLNTFFDAAINEEMEDILEQNWNRNATKSQLFKKAYESFKNRMPSKAMGMYQSRSPFWGKWEKYADGDMKTIMGYTLGGIVKLDIESSGLGLSEISDLHEDLLRLKNVNPALSNKIRIDWLDTKNDYVLAYAKVNGDAKMIFIANSSNRSQKITFDPKGLEGAYSNIFEQSSINIQEALTIEMQPLEYILLSNRF